MRPGLARAPDGDNGGGATEGCCDRGVLRQSGSGDEGCDNGADAKRAVTQVERKRGEQAGRLSEGRETPDGDCAGTERMRERAVRNRAKPIR